MSIRIHVYLWAFLLFLGACRLGKTDSIQVHLITRPSPPTIGESLITIHMTDEAGKPVRGAEMQLEGNMSHPGMKPVFGQAREVAPGEYAATLEFTMSGDWFVLVDATLPDGKTIRKQVDIPGVRSK